MSTQHTIEQVLATYPRARHDDKYLILKVWQGQGLPLNREFVETFLSKRISSSESIRRTRQKLQEQGKYQPESGVRRARKALAETIRQQIPKEPEAMKLFE